MRLRESLAQKVENLNSQLTSQGIKNRNLYEEALTEVRQLIKEKMTGESPLRFRL